jgi:hypothetical protein
MKIKRPIYIVVFLTFCFTTAVMAVGQSADAPPTPDAATVVIQEKPTTAAIKPVALDATKVHLYVYRHRRYEGGALKPSVYVDDKEMARIENGRFFVVNLDPGKHSIRSSDKSSGVDVEMKSGSDYYVRIDIQPGLLKGHGRLTLILPEQGEYEIKKTKPLSDGAVKDRELVTRRKQ